MFVTAQGQPLTRYRRALDRKHIFGAEIAAREMGYVSLRDALGLLALYASVLDEVVGDGVALPAGMTETSPSAAQLWICPECFDLFREHHGWTSQTTR